MISVCMATYNGERFILKQISSILEQLSENDELIVSDDGSTDRTLDIIKSFDDCRIKILNHKKNKNFEKIKYSRNFYYVTDNFENALKNAKGDYIFLSDQDDIWLPNKVAKVMEQLKIFDCTLSNFKIINENDSILSEQFYDENPISQSFIKNILNCRFLGCGLAFRKSVLDFVLPFPRKLMAHDLWIGMIGKHKFSFSYIITPLFLYRRSGSNVSPSCEKSTNSIFHKVGYRLNIVCLLLLRFLRRKKISKCIN